MRGLQIHGVRGVANRGSFGAREDDEEQEDGRKVITSDDQDASRCEESHLSIGRLGKIKGVQGSRHTTQEEQPGAHQGQEEDLGGDGHRSFGGLRVVLQPTDQGDGPENEEHAGQQAENGDEQCIDVVDVLDEHGQRRHGHHRDDPKECDDRGGDPPDE